MAKTVRSVVETLFASTGPVREPAACEWRLVRRQRRPFLLLRPDLRAARTGLVLYSAQRRRARLWRALLPLLLQTPAARWLFERVHFQADAASEFMQFLAQQAGVPAAQAIPAAIKLSEVGLRSRLVLLLCDESGRPARVVKVGLNAEGRAANDREADFLAQLPPQTIGCIRMTGRFAAPSLSAFATDYFPGSSLEDDAGMEHLFHAWLNPDPPVPLASLPLWSDLAAAATTAAPAAWQFLSARLAGKTVRTTLYHGDFTPWNVRAVNFRNLQAFDWERGSLRGIPGWDWFHFTTQTAILARRCSVERVAAEVEELIHSPRFKQFAAAAGISEFVRPLLLAYLLHHRWVIKPQDGGQTAAELYELLAAHWHLKPPTPALPAPTPAPAPGLLATARRQLQSAVDQWANLFWEPRLNSRIPLPLASSLTTHWPFLLLTVLLLAAVAGTQYISSSNLIFLPFYLVIGSLVTWKIGRRWGALTATVAAVAGPLAVAARNPEYRSAELWLWNVVMRFMVLQMCVLFVDRIHKQREFSNRRLPPAGPAARPAESWAVMLASGVFLAVVAGMDWLTDPHMTFLPLYLFPCMVITLVLNLRWGLVATVVAAFLGAGNEYLTNWQASMPIFGWNFLMRFAVYLLVLVLLDHLRRENILFVRRKP